MRRIGTGRCAPGSRATSASPWSPNAWWTRSRVSWPPASDVCGRTNLTATPEELAEAFALDETPALAPRYNIAPSQPMPAVRMDAARRKRRLVQLRWGLVPHWASHPAAGARLINARSESAHTRPAFRDPFRE